MPNQLFFSYEQLSAVLHQMLEHLDSNELKPLRQVMNNGQQVFREQILTTDITDIHLPQGIQLQSINTEISKELRLLNTDLMFLTTARQGKTVEQRTTQMRDRLKRLSTYCEIVLENIQR